MAGALGTSLSLLLPFTSISRKHISPKSSFSASSQRKLAKRKNYLREKILKTLTKPYPNFPLPVPIETPPAIDPLVPFESPLEQILAYPSVEVAGEEPKESKIQEVRVAEVSEPRIVVNNGKSSALKLLSWLVAAVIVPTIYVRVFGSADFDSKNGNFARENEKDEILEIGAVGNSKSKLKLFLNGNENGWIGVVDEAEMERKIEEVKMMAREARAMEKIEAAKSSVSDSGDDEDDNSSVSNTIGKLPASLVGYLRRNGERKDRPRTGGFDEKEMNDALLFKKKHKFRNFSGKPSDKPNGFMAPLKPHGEEQGQRRHVQTPKQGKGDVSHGVGKTSLEEKEKNSEGERQDVVKSLHRTSNILKSI